MSYTFFWKFTYNMSYKTNYKILSNLDALKTR